MNRKDFLEQCKQELSMAEEDGKKLAAFHLIVLRNAEMLEDISAADFCSAVGVKPGFAAEFTQMKALNRRMREKNVWLVQLDR